MYMLEAVEATAHGTTEKINAIRDLLAETLDTAKRALPKTVFSKELIEDTTMTLRLPRPLQTSKTSNPPTDSLLACVRGFAVANI